MSMKQVNYLKKGENYIFYQSFDFDMAPLMKFYDLDDEITLGELKKMNEDKAGGYVSIDKNGCVYFRNSNSLGMQVDLIHLDSYRENKKRKFTNLRFV